MNRRVIPPLQRPPPPPNTRQSIYLLYEPLARTQARREFFIFFKLIFFKHNRSHDSDFRLVVKGRLDMDLLIRKLKGRV